jgi:hypothetical protein
VPGKEAAGQQAYIIRADEEELTTRDKDDLAGQVRHVLLGVELGHVGSKDLCSDPIGG